MHHHSNLPRHYQKLYASFIRLACYMAFFALGTGILFRESTRKLSETVLQPGMHWDISYHLALVHGHIFLIGVLIPVALLGIVHLAFGLNGKALPEKYTAWGGRLYHIGAGLTAILILYKGYHYVLSARAGNLDLQAIQQHYFAGQVMLRQIVYGISHTSLGTGLGIILVGVLQSLPSQKQMGSG